MPTTAPPTCRGAGSWRGSGLTCFRRDCRTRAHWLSAHQKRSATIRVGESRSQSPRLSDSPSGRWRRMPERRNLPLEGRTDYLMILVTYSKTRRRVSAVLWTAADRYGAGGIRTHDTIQVHICPQRSVGVRRTRFGAKFSATSQSLRSRNSVKACTRTAFRRLPTTLRRSDASA